jgi:hypothetical protein
MMTTLLRRTILSLVCVLMLSMGEASVWAAGTSLGTGAQGPAPNDTAFFIKNNTGSQLDGAIHVVYANNAYGLNREDVSIAPGASFKFVADFQGGILHIASAVWVVTFGQTPGNPPPILFFVKDRISAGYTVTCGVVSTYKCTTDDDGIHSVLSIR